MELAAKEKGQNVMQRLIRPTQTALVGNRTHSQTRESR